MMWLLGFQMSRSGTKLTCFQHWLSGPSQPSSTDSLLCCNSDWRGILMKENPKLVLKCARTNVAGISLNPDPPHVFHVLFSNYAVRDANWLTATLCILDKWVMEKNCLCVFERGLICVGWNICNFMLLFKMQDLIERSNASLLVKQIGRE